MSKDDITNALLSIASNLESPNESDNNMEIANIVDALFFIGRCIKNFPSYYEHYSPKTDEALNAIAISLGDVADAIRERDK